MAIKQVTSLELSKELKENGYPQTGLFWWWKVPGFRQMRIWFIREIPTKRKKIVAPTGAELGNKLPESIYYKNTWYFYRQYKNVTHGVHIAYRDNNGFTLHREINTEANARAKMWLYLKKKGLVK